MTNSTDALAAYLRRAQTWDGEIHRGLARSRAIAWAVAGASLVIATLSVTALVLLLPLKEFAPFVIAVDQTTGYAEVARGLDESPLTGERAVTEANLVRFVTARETYDPVDIRPRFEEVRRTSAGAAWEEYRALWTPNAAHNPAIKHGWTKRIRVQVKAISFLKDDVASIRYRRIETDARSGAIAASDWVAIAAFAYSKAPMKMRDRWANPLGFRVTSFRADQEALQPAAPGLVQALALEPAEALAAGAGVNAD